MHVYIDSWINEFVHPELTFKNLLYTITVRIYVFITKVMILLQYVITKIYYTSLLLQLRSLNHPNLLSLLGLKQVLPTRTITEPERR